MAEPSSSSCKLTRSENTDIISTLPDHLLQHILSFLPIKQVVAISLLLSKRFKPLGLTMPSLNLQDSAFPSLNSFIQFVDALLFLSHLKPIKMFRLNCKKKSFKVLPIRINLSVNTVMSRKIEHLELYFASSYRHIDVPTCVFHNQSIRVLKLTRVMVNARSPVHLPSLKVLYLGRVNFSGPESAYNILTRCPFLEELEFQSYYWEKLIIPNLGTYQHLISAKVPALHISVLSALSNVKFLRVESCFITKHYMVPNICSIPTFYTLTELELPFLCIGDLSKFVECLGGFPKLEILNIHKLVPISWRRPMEEAILDVPQCVASNLQKFSLGDYQGLDCEYELATFIMKNASNLRTISISCSEVVDADSKLQMISRLSSSRRASANCRLFFKYISEMDGAVIVEVMSSIRFFM